MNDQADKAIAKVDTILRQFTDAYEKVTDDLATVMADLIEMQADIKVIEEFVNQHCTDAVAARDTWIAVAKVHKARAKELQVQIQLLTQKGHRIEVDIPLRGKNEVAAALPGETGGE